MGARYRIIRHFHGFLEVWRIAACFFVIVSIGSAFGRDFDGLGLGWKRGLYMTLSLPPSFLGHFSFVEISGLGLVNLLLVVYRSFNISG